MAMMHIRGSESTTCLMMMNDDVEYYLMLKH